MPDGGIAQWIEAVGTFVTAVIALFTTLYYEVWKPRRDRPRLQIYYDNDDPQCRRFSPSGLADVGSSYFIRLKVVNTGRAPAERCIGRLVAIADENRRLRKDWDISSLAWTGQRRPEPIYLSPRGDHSYIDLIQVVEGEREFKLRVDRTPRAIKLDYEPGQYYFLVVVYAERAEPVEQWFRVTWNGKFDEFAMEKSSKLEFGAYR